MLLIIIVLLLFLNDELIVARSRCLPSHCNGLENENKIKYELNYL